ncbi:nucleoside recognition domain-containing protein [Desulfothermus okinawensis JCM 13304]
MKKGSSSIILSFALSIVLIYFIFRFGHVTGPVFLKKVLFPLVRMLFFISIGLVIGEIIEATGWTRYLAVIAKPLFKFAHLDERCAATFTVAFFSGVGANTMLYNFYKNGKIDKKEVILTNIMNQLPAFFLHLPSTIFIIIPLTGKAGIVYLVLVFTAIILRIFLLSLFGHFFLEEEESSIQLDNKEIIQKTFKHKQDIPRRILKKVPKRILHIVKFVFPIFLGVFLLKQLGVFDGLRDIIASTLIGKIMPVESLSMVVLSFIADYTSGFVTAGALLSQHVLTFKQGVIAILLGNIIAIPMRALRHQLPRFLGIFSPGLGTQVLVIGQLTRAISLIVVGTIYFFVF